MTPEEFRAAGKDVIDWIADYWTSIEDHPVLSTVDPGWVADQLPTSPPEQGEEFATLMADVDRVVIPGITHWQHPGFHAYFNTGASGPSVLGDLLASGLGVLGMLWSTSPAATEVETRVLDWLADLLDLPTEFRSTATGGGVIQDSASSATLAALLAARERTTGGASNDRGVRQGTAPMSVYASEHAHSSVEKAVRIAGFGSAHLRSISTDDEHRMRPDALDAWIKRDLDHGFRPAAVIATVGTTSSTAIDPVRRIGEITSRRGIWLHVDGALAGTAALLPEMRWIHDGLELADSYVVNPHKWMLTNFDCSAFWVRDRGALVAALSILPEYLRNQASDSGAVIDYRDWQVPLGRRFRALKLWFVIRSFGAEGLREIVRHHLELAATFEAWVREHPSYELAAPTTVNLVCFRHIDGDDASRRVMESVNASGDAFFTHSVLDGRVVLRVAIGAERTEQRHIDHLCDLLATYA
jgi:aromatic-L-amino-acid decarboxylase